VVSGGYSQEMTRSPYHLTRRAFQSADGVSEDEVVRQCGGRNPASFS
jgi:hypothetical protein